MEVQLEMKLINFAILFSVISICIFTVLDMKEIHLDMAVTLQNKYNNILDNAVEEAMINIVESDWGRKRIINLSEVEENFFINLFINFDIMGNSILEERIKLYIPVIGIVLEEGVVFIYHEFENGRLVTKRTDIAHYTYQDEYYKFYFSLDDYIKVVYKNDNNVIEGYYGDLSKIIENCFGTYENFEEIKSKTIINTISENMEYYIEKHNYIAEAKGIKYKFVLPYIDKEDWYRTIKDISLIAVFQGYPYGNSTLGYYNQVAIGGARTYKKVTDMEG